jgi:Mn2+/Fe2+ NRAMP family transporter
MIAIIPGLPLMRVLVVTQFINGLLLPVMLVAILRLAGDRKLMGDYVNGAVYNALAWLLVLVVSGLSLLLAAKTIFGGES